MILQGSLRIKYRNSSFQLEVKTFLKEKAYYFFISDKEMERQLLNGKTLELTYIDSFSNWEEPLELNEQKFSVELVNAIKNMLLENIQSWYYSKHSSNPHL